MAPVPAIAPTDALLVLGALALLGPGLPIVLRGLGRSFPVEGLESGLVAPPERGG